MNPPGPPQDAPGPEHEPDDHTYTQLALGMAIGLVLGLGMGVATGDLVLTLPLGAALGVVLGLALGHRDDGHGSSIHGRQHPRPPADP